MLILLLSTKRLWFPLAHPLLLSYLLILMEGSCHVESCSVEGPC